MRKNRIALGLALSLAISNIPLVSYADEISNSEVVESSVDSEESIEEKTEESTEENAEESTEESTTESTEESSEESPEKSTEESTKESTTESTTESTEESTVEIKESTNISSSKSSTRKSRSSKVIDESDRTQGSNITLKVATSSDATDPDNPDGGGGSGGGDTPVDPETFSVTVPVTIPISMDLEGKISIPSDLKIINNNESAIKCVDIDLMLDSSWNAVDFDSFLSDVQSISNTNDFSIAFRGDKLGSDGLILVTENSWNFGANDSLSLNTRARLTKQQAGLESDLGTVNFSFDWSSKDISSSNDIGSDIPENLIPSSEKVTVTFVASEGVSFKGTSGNIEVLAGETITLPEVEISNLRQSVGSWLNAETQEPVTVVDGKLTVDKAMSLTVSLVEKVASNQNWFTASGNTLTGLSDEYLNMVDAPTDLVIPNNIGGSSITNIGSGAFKNKDLLTSVVVPSTVTSIAPDAFSGCNIGLKIDVSYAAKNSISYTYTDLLWGVRRDNIIWHPTLTDVMAWDTNPVQVEDLDRLGLELKNGNTICMKTSGHPEFIDIPSSVNGVKIVSVVEPWGGTWKNNATKYIRIPSSVETLGKAFERCTVLKYVWVPDSVVEINTYAFPNTAKVYYSGTAVGSPWRAKSVVPNIREDWDTNPMWTPDLAKNGLKLPVEYAVAITDKGFSDSNIAPSVVNIPTSVNGIKIYKLGKIEDTDNDGNSFITEVNIPDTITWIGVSFSNCVNLENIIIPDSVTRIDEKAFFGCRSLKDLVVPNSVTTIGIDAFNGLDIVKYSGIATGSPWGALSVVPNN